MHLPLVKSYKGYRRTVIRWMLRPEQLLAVRWPQRTPASTSLHHTTLYVFFLATKELERRRRVEPDEQERKKPINQIGNLRRKMVREKHNWKAKEYAEKTQVNDWKKSEPTSHAVQLDGQEDRIEWPAAFSRHYREICAQASPEREVRASNLRSRI